MIRLFKQITIFNIINSKYDVYAEGKIYKVLCFFNCVFLFFIYLSSELFKGFEEK